MEKDFFDVFPHLKVKKELEELLDMVFVTKVSMNPGRTHLRVYIESSRWIHKKNIFALEDEIERQCFPGIPMTVTVVEKFHLSVHPGEFPGKLPFQYGIGTAELQYAGVQSVPKNKDHIYWKRYHAYGTSGHRDLQTEERDPR